MGAVTLLEHHGFDITEAGFQPWKVWEFILRHPEVEIWIEESALKAMAACSIGQIAIGLNGINGWGQQGRSDRLHPFLKRLAKGRQGVTVRFDRAGSKTSQSQIQAQKLARAMERHGAQGSGWWTWLHDMPGKTDDVIAAVARRELSAEQKQLLWWRVSTACTRSTYRRLQRSWPGVSINREFSADDVLQAALAHRVLVLKGATGTAKSKAMVAGLALLEAHTNQKHVVLGAYHRSSLVHKGAAEYGVADISALPGTPEREGLHEGPALRDGLFCCGESAYKGTGEKSLWHWYQELREHPRPTVLILDEISQVLANWVMGGTDMLRPIRGKALDALEGLVQLECVRVWAADALVGDLELEWLQQLTGVAPYLLSSIYTRSRELFLGLPNQRNERTLLLQLGDVSAAGDRFWLGHGTVAGLDRLLGALPAAAKGTELKITGEEKCRENPRVERFLADAEAEGPQYLRVGFSPAVSCGISMAKTPVALSAVVQDYCWQAEDVVQALNRCRNSARRILLAPKVVPDALGITKETDARRASKAFQEHMLEGSHLDYTVLLQARHPASRAAVAKLEARRNFEAFQNDWCLRGLLEEEGYILRAVEELEQEGAQTVLPEGGQRREVLRTPEALQQFRLEALQRLVEGTSTLEDVQHEARRRIQGGTHVDLAECDVSETWKVAQELHLDALIRAGMVHGSSPEMEAVWAVLTSLDKAGARRVARAMGGRADRIPGPMDALDVRRVWPLVKALGFQVVKAGETKREGNRWRIEPMDLRPPGDAPSSI
ncbi:DUF3854 domain-containing protein [Synechococcus sp. CCY9201]|uniref:DUF3854 domain-containing protein n=1 Tax=Synechococcus sp. CCY9201 TaxID=174697 RepID=UPI002B2073DF|nr:DUF3854 domain-containing protein [Synechococcus sp. CCY9201]